MTHTIFIGIPFVVGLAGESQAMVSPTTVAAMFAMASRRLMREVADLVGRMRDSMMLA